MIVPTISEYSTYATSYERVELTQNIDNEWYRAAFQAGCNAPLLIKRMSVESISDYQSPDPIRSYPVKLRITSSTKGLPVNYDEKFEDDL